MFMTDEQLLTDEQFWKANFVASELSEALNCATRGFVDYCEYRVKGPEEFVIVRLTYDDGKYDTMTVNVTSDSNWAILKDVMKAVAARFE